MTGPVFDSSVYESGVPTLQARFFNKFVPNKTASEEKGIIDGKEIPYIEIQVDERTRHCRKATEEDKRQYAQQWAAFEGGDEQPIVGTPLNECAVLASKEREMFKLAGIRSVEQLLNCPDTIMQRIPEAYRMQKTVKRWAEAGAERAKTAHLRKMIDEQSDEIAYLKGQLEEMSERFCKATGEKYEPAAGSKTRSKTKTKNKQEIEQ